jgi:hypothetical protein
MGGTKVMVCREKEAEITIILPFCMYQLMEVGVKINTKCRYTCRYS